MKERFGTLRWRQNLRTGEKRFRSARLRRRARMLPQGLARQMALG